MESLDTLRKLKPWDELTEAEKFERQKGKGCDLCKRNGIGSALAMTAEAAAEGCTLEALTQVSGRSADDPARLLKLEVCRDCRKTFLLRLQLFVDQLHRDWRKRANLVQLAEAPGNARKSGR